MSESGFFIVYVVTIVAVYDHGCAGVFTTRDAAVDHAKVLADDSDGHHDFRIDELILNAPIWPTERWLGPDGIRRARFREPKIIESNRG